MSENKSKVLYLGILLCILINSFWGFSFSQENFEYDAKGKRNPFVPLVTPDGRILKLDKDEEMEGLSIEGIIYDRYGPSYAIVNGSVVGAGDSVKDFRVLKVEKNKVIFIKDGAAKEVEFTKEEK